MAEVNVNRDITVQSRTQTNASKAMATGFFLNYAGNYAVVEVKFVDSGSNTLLTEMWAIRGSTMLLALNRANQGATALEEIDEALEFIIDHVENTPGRKDTLIALGSLEVTKGSIVNGIRPWSG